MNAITGGCTEPSPPIDQPLHLPDMTPLEAWINEIPTDNQESN